MVLSDFDAAWQALFPWLLGSSVLFLSVGAWLPTRVIRSERRITYGRSWWLRMASLSLAAIVISTPIICRNDPAFRLATAEAVIPAILALFFAGPYEMTFDLQRETYRVRIGWPFFWGCWKGPLTDIGCVKVVSHCSDSGGLLMLWWRDKKRFPFALGYYGSRRRARQKAEETAGAVNIPLRPVPAVM